MQIKNDTVETIQHWNYAYDADITFGEVHESKLPKIILVFTLLGILVIGIGAYLFKDYILDYINNPQVMFNDKVFLNEKGLLCAETEISNINHFDPKTYILGYNSKTKEIEDAQYNVEVDTSQFKKEVGEYPIIYHSSNRVISEDYTIMVSVKDKTDPVILLELDDTKPYHVDLSESSSYKLTIIRQQDTKNFDPKNYIKSVSDNYDKDISIDQVEYPKEIDFTANTVDVIYSIQDKYGNTGTTSLTLFIKDDVSQIEKEKQEAIDKAKEEYDKKLKEEKAKQEAAEKARKEAEEKAKKEAEEKAAKDEASRIAEESRRAEEEASRLEEERKKATERARKEAEEEASRKAAEESQRLIEEPSSISAKNVTVSLKAVNNDETIIAQKCIDALTYKGTHGSATPYGMPGYDIPLDVGVYKITWKTTDGLSCIQTLTIKE